MTDEHFNFNNPEDSGASELPQTRSFFGEIQFWAIPITKPMEKSPSSFTLPDVKAHKSGELKVFNRQRVKTSEHILFVLVGWTRNSEGEIYNKVSQPGSWDEEWKLQYPVLNQLPAKPRDAFAASGREGKRLFARWEEADTKALLPEDMWDKFNPVTGEPIPKYKAYWQAIAFFEDEKSMLEADREFRAQFEDGSEEDAWISRELQDDLERQYPDWQQLIAIHGLGYLKEQALKYAGTAPALLKAKMGMSEELAVEIINAAKGIVPKEIEVTPKEMPF